MTSIPRVALAIALAFLFAHSEQAAAAPDDGNRAKVRALYETATKHYNLSEFQEALNDYKEAYRLRADPAFLFNIAQCYRQLNDPSAAAKSYRAFLREQPNAKNRAGVEKLIEDMDKAVAEKRITQPPLGTEPPKSEGKEPGSTTANETPPETPPAEKPAPETERPPFYTDIVGDVLVGAGIVVVLAGVGLIVGASSMDSQAASSGVDLRQRESAWSTGGTLAITSYSAFAVGAVLVAAGVVKWVTRPKAAPEKSVGWNIDLRPGQVFAGISGRF
jgi:tetratricopeptide (TPR) repeat protein